VIYLWGNLLVLFANPVVMGPCLRGDDKGTDCLNVMQAAEPARLRGVGFRAIYLP
jgi:hypothetical protein